MQVDICSAPARSARRAARTSAPTHPLLDLDGLAETIRYSRDREICSEAGKSEYWYRVVSGAARRCMVRSDGRRRILDLLVPGEFFGFHVRDDYGLTVEAAAEGAAVVRYPRWCVDFLAEAEPATARALGNLALQAVARMQVQLLIVGRMPARAKVSAFLLDMDDRLPHRPDGSFDLPVPHRDIADYLALSVETVSLALRILSERRTIACSGARRVRIDDRVALEQTADEIDVGRSRQPVLAPAGEGGARRQVRLGGNPGFVDGRSNESLSRIFRRFRSEAALPPADRRSRSLR